MLHRGAQARGLPGSDPLGGRARLEGVPDRRPGFVPGPDGLPLLAAAGPLAVLIARGLASFLLALAIFRWQ